MKAYESSSPSAIAEAVFSIRLSRAKGEAEEAKKIAQRRSGTRGSVARKELLKAEALVSDYEQRSDICYTSTIIYRPDFFIQGFRMLIGEPKIPKYRSKQLNYFQTRKTLSTLYVDTA